MFSDPLMTTTNDHDDDERLTQPQGTTLFGAEEHNREQRRAREARGQGGAVPAALATGRWRSGRDKIPPLTNSRKRRRRVQRAQASNHLVPGRPLRPPLVHLLVREHSEALKRE